jgi:hypothetical protein
MESDNPINKLPAMSISLTMEKSTKQKKKTRKREKKG